MTWLAVSLTYVTVATNARLFGTINMDDNELGVAKARLGRCLCALVRAVIHDERSHCCIDGCDGCAFKHAEWLFYFSQILDGTFRFRRLMCSRRRVGGDRPR